MNSNLIYDLNGGSSFNRKFRESLNLKLKENGMVSILKYNDERPTSQWETKLCIVKLSNLLHHKIVSDWLLQSNIRTYGYTTATPYKNGVKLKSIINNEDLYGKNISKGDRETPSTLSAIIESEFGTITSYINLITQEGRFCYIKEDGSRLYESHEKSVNKLVEDLAFTVEVIDDLVGTTVKLPSVRGEYEKLTNKDLDRIIDTIIWIMYDGDKYEADFAKRYLRKKLNKVKMKVVNGIEELNIAIKEDNITKMIKVYKEINEGVYHPTVGMNSYSSMYNDFKQGVEYIDMAMMDIISFEIINNFSNYNDVEHIYTSGKMNTVKDMADKSYLLKNQTVKTGNSYNYIQYDEGDFSDRMKNNRHIPILAIMTNVINNRTMEVK